MRTGEEGPSFIEGGGEGGEGGGGRGGGVPMCHKSET